MQHHRQLSVGSSSTADSDGLPQICVHSSSDIMMKPRLHSVLSAQNADKQEQLTDSERVVSLNICSARQGTLIDRWYIRRAMMVDYIGLLNERGKNEQATFEMRQVNWLQAVTVFIDCSLLLGRNQGS